MAELALSPRLLCATKYMAWSEVWGLGGEGSARSSDRLKARYRVWHAAELLDSQVAAGRRLLQDPFFLNSLHRSRDAVSHSHLPAAAEVCRPPVARLLERCVGFRQFLLQLL